MSTIRNTCLVATVAILVGLAPAAFAQSSGGIGAGVSGGANVGVGGAGVSGGASTQDKASASGSKSQGSASGNSQIEQNARVPGASVGTDLNGNAKANGSMGGH